MHEMGKNIYKQYTEIYLTIKHDVVRVDHGQEVLERDVDLALGPRPQTHGAGLRDGAEVVGTLLAVLRVPAEAESVGDGRRYDGGAIVAAHSNQHDAQLGHLAACAEGVGGGHGRGHQLAIGQLDVGGLVAVLALDERVGVGHVGAVHFYGHGANVWVFRRTETTIQAELLITTENGLQVISECTKYNCTSPERSCLSLWCLGQ